MSSTITHALDLDNLTDEQFADLVAQDVRNNIAPELASFIRLPQNLSRWRKSLTELMRSLDFQLSCQRQETTRTISDMTVKGSSHEDIQNYIVGVQKWKTSTLRFKRAAEQKLGEVKTLQSNLYHSLIEMNEILHTVFDSLESLMALNKLDEDSVNEIIAPAAASAEHIMENI